MPGQTLRPGDRTSFGCDSLTYPYSAFFEDDGDTGYFYALDLTRSDDMILDAVHIYNVANVSDRERESCISIVWSGDGMQCALMINDRAHAAFDFAAQRGYCRTNFPNLPKTHFGWGRSDHQWSDEAIVWLK